MNVPHTRPSSSQWPGRLLSIALAFGLLELIGGIVLSISLVDGRIIALTALMAGVVVALGLLWSTRDEIGKGSSSLLRLTFAGSGG